MPLRARRPDFFLAEAGPKPCYPSARPAKIGAACKRDVCHKLRISHPINRGSHALEGDALCKRPLMDFMPGKSIKLLDRIAEIPAVRSTH